MAAGHGPAMYDYDVSAKSIGRPTIDEDGHYSFAVPPMMAEPVPHAAGVRSLGSFGFCDLEFDIGGKKSRRRYVKATSPQGEKFSILTTTGRTWP